MIKTDEFGVVTVGGMTDSLFSEYATEELEDEEKK